MTLPDAIVQQAPLAIAVYDLDGRLVYGNAAYERHFGVRVADVPATFSLFTDPQLEAAGLLPGIRRAYAGESVVLPPVRYDAAQASEGAGRVVWTEAHCFPLRAGDGDVVTHLAIVQLDVTGWATTDAALRSLTADAQAARAVAEQERARLGEILAQLPAAVAVYEGPDLRVRALSAAYRHMIGGRDVLGLPIREALAEMSDQRFFEHMEEVYATGRPLHGTNVPASWDVDGDGEREDRVVDFTYGPLMGAAGHPDGVVALVIDVSERARLELAERDARAAAEDSAARLAAVLEALPDAAAVYDADWRYTYLNPAARALHDEVFALVGGAPPGGSALGHVAWDLFPWLAGTQFDVESRRAMRAGVVVEYVEHVAPLDRWLETRIIPIATGVVSLNRDVTAQRALEMERRRLHEAELRVTEQRAALLESIQDAFIALDGELRMTYVNRRAEQLLRRPAAELLGRSVDDAFPEGRNLPLRLAVRGALDRRESLHVEEFSVVTGGWLDVRVSPAPDGVSVLMQDVTARRRAQESAAFMAEASRLLAASLDFEVTLRAVAEAAVPQLGDWCAVDLLVVPGVGDGAPVVERLAVVQRDPVRLAQWEELKRRYPTDWSRGAGPAGVLRTGVPLLTPELTDEMLAASARDPGHLALLRALGWRSVIVVPMVAHDRVLGVITLCRSEGSRRYDEADLALARDLAQRAAIAIDNARHFRDAERARLEAEEANRAKSQFLATMSHELRTPLNAIAGHVQLVDLGLHGPVTDAQRDALARVGRAQRHLLGLINDVLRFARIEGGYMEYDVRPVALSDVVQHVVPMVEPQLQGQGLALEVSADGDAPVHALADAEKLGQILLNLLSNAIKFTAAGGRVAIEVAKDADAGTALVRVRDTGIGIPADRLERIFDPFVQLRSSPYTPGGGGTGLGLAISRDLARGMGGNVRAESVEGRGSTFVVSLPLERDGA